MVITMIPVHVRRPYGGVPVRPSRHILTAAGQRDLRRIVVKTARLFAPAVHITDRRTGRSGHRSTRH